MVLMVSDILWNGINIIKNTVVNVKVIFIERSVDTLQNYQNLCKLKNTVKGTIIDIIAPEGLRCHASP